MCFLLKIKMVVKSCFFLCLLSLGYSSVIIPEELPSLLSVAYSNIPPIKKGTDSRVGFGFAFGNHADFQVMFELGPQTNTAPLTGPAGSSNAKRQAPTPPKLTKNREKLLQTEAGSYLQNWASAMRRPGRPPLQASTELPSLEDSVVELVKNSKGEYEIHQPRPDHIPLEVMDELQRLYGQKKEEAKKMTQKAKEKKRSDAEVKKITEDLSNVDLD
ncbi:uncharacterized protein LOC133532946 [Cydia pomonella]|uniref:uncharacterized protein LOC133532946 n=1 Tax=Cydia pomonella TaxID=82600 RepID=UPI002ADE3A88|nr:uncharacterized protein LOC133532946 [Cydia pomonella]